MAGRNAHKNASIIGKILSAKRVEPMRLATVLSGLFILLAGCRSIWVRGVIQTADEHPIANASVTARSAGPGTHVVAGASEPNGCFDLFHTIRRNENGYFLEVNSPGYKPVKIALAIHVENLLLVTLEPTASPQASQARPIRSDERPLRYGPCEPLVSGSRLSLR
jgi:hypothetical protein